MGMSRSRPKLRGQLIVRRCEARLGLIMWNCLLMEINTRPIGAQQNEAGVLSINRCSNVLRSLSPFIEVRSPSWMQNVNTPGKAIDENTQERNIIFFIQIGKYQIRKIWQYVDTMESSSLMSYFLINDSKIGPIALALFFKYLF